MGNTTKVVARHVKRLTTEEFVVKAKQVHGDKYSYETARYKTSAEKLEIICREHGPFLQLASGHLRGYGCAKCAAAGKESSRPMPFVEFARLASEKHDGKYTYVESTYTKANKKVTIVCPSHGLFSQNGASHLAGKGCRKCSTEVNSEKQRLKLEEFIQKSTQTHGVIYDYSEVNYINIKTKVKISCQTHGPFWMIPLNHFAGQGCPSCGRIKQAKSNAYTFNEFVKMARAIHGDIYEYDPDSFSGMRGLVRITCVAHGEFSQTACAHVNGQQGCPDCGVLCGAKSRTKPFDVFLKRAVSVHGSVYWYDRDSYINTNTKTRIVCREHGEFWQIPGNHLNGRGCPSCCESSGERHVAAVLTELGVQFVREKTFDACADIGPLPFDFFVPSHELLIEYDGAHHFEPVCWYGKRWSNLSLIQRRDNIKNTFAANNNLNLLRVPYTEKGQCRRLIVDALSDSFSPGKVR